MTGTISGILTSGGNAGVVLLIPPYCAPALIKRSVALTRGSLGNLRVVSLRGFVADAIITVIPNQRLISHKERIRIFSLIVKKHKQELNYFNEVSDFPGFIRHLAETTEELSLNRVIKADCPTGPKWDDLFMLLDAFNAKLNNEDLLDYPRAVEELLKAGPKAVMGYFTKQHFTQAEKALVEGYGFKLLEEDTSTRQPKLAAYKVDTQYQEALQTVRNIRDDLKRFAAGDERKPLRIGVVVDDYQAYYSHFSSIAEKLGAKSLFHFAKGVPLFASSAGDLLGYYIEWMENHFSTYRWLKILESPAFKKDGLTDDKYEIGDYFKALKLIAGAKLPLFNSGFAKAVGLHLDGKVVRDEDDIDAGSNEEDQANNLRVRLAKRVVEIFEPVAAAETPVEKLAAIGKIFDKYTSSNRGRSAAVASSVIAGMAEVPEVYDGLSVEELASRLREEARGRYIKYEPFGFDRVIVGTPDDLAMMEFDRLYILGLSEKGLPKKVHENPLLLDSEKDAITTTGKNFLSVGRVSKNNDESFWRMVLIAGEVMLSVPVKDMASGKDRLVSRYMLEAFEKLNGEKYDFEGMAKHLTGEALSGNNYLPKDPADALYDYELAAKLMVDTPPIGGKVHGLKKEFPYRKKIKSFIRARWYDTAFNAYSGILDLEPNRELRAFSATSFSEWLICPYKYYLNREMRLDRSEDFSAKELEWLDHLHKGNFLHEVFFRFLTKVREVKGDGFTQIDESDREYLDSAFKKVLEEFEQKIPVISRVYQENQLSELQWIADRFLKNEMENNDTRLYFELAAGLSEKEGRDPRLFRSEPIEIKVNESRTIKLRGSIDRIDRASDDSLILYDYKTGKVNKSTPNDPFLGGSLIQAGLYPFMARQILETEETTKFRYLYSSKTGQFEKTDIEFNKQNEEFFLQFLERMLGEIERGNFVPVGTGDKHPPCEYCDYKEVCIKQISQQLKENRAKDTNFNEYKSTKAMKPGAQQLC